MAAELSSRHHGPVTPLAKLSGLLADSSRAEMCLALLDGRAWTLGELARLAHIAPSTATAHVTALVEGGLVTASREGRHRYVRIADAATAALLEDLAAHAGHLYPATAPRTLREAKRNDALVRARTCYDHLAGRLGVAVTEAMVGKRILAAPDFALTAHGSAWLSRLDIELPSRRPPTRRCLDWTERRHHLAGAVGAAVCAHAFAHDWVRRIGTSRALRVTDTGRDALAELLGLRENQWS